MYFFLKKKNVTFKGLEKGELKTLNGAGTNASFFQTTPMVEPPFLS